MMTFKGVCQYQSGYGGIGRHIGLRSQLLQVQLLLSGSLKYRRDMTTFNFHLLYQQLFTSLRGRESPISYVQKIVEKTPDSRFDIRFQSQFEDYKRIKHLLVLNDQERIALDMILQGETYEKLVKFKVREIIKQYEKNDFRINPISFLILFQDIASDSSVETFRDQLSNGLKIPLTNVHLCSTKEMREEIGDVKTIFSQYYSLEYKDYLMEQQMVFSKTIKDLSNHLLNKREREKMEELVKGLENPLSIKDKEIKRLLRRLVSLDRRVESLNSGVSEGDEVPPSSDIFDVD